MTEAGGNAIARAAERRGAVGYIAGPAHREQDHPHGRPSLGAGAHRAAWAFHEALYRSARLETPSLVFVEPGSLPNGRRGQSCMPAGPVEVEDNLPFEAEMMTVYHEYLHHVYPDWSETEVQAQEGYWRVAYLEALEGPRYAVAV